MSNRLRWQAVAVLSAVLFLLTNQSSQAQSCDPSDPTCAALTGGDATGSTGTTTGMPTSQGGYGQQGGGGVNAGSMSSGTLGTIPSFNPQTGFPASANYQDSLSKAASATDWWEQYRFNPDRAMRLAQATEFQRMVAASTGRTLPLFGADLFWGSPSTFAPIEQAPITPDYVIGTGDQLLIRVWGQVSVNAQVTVDRSGSIFLPQVGEIHAAGVPFSALQGLLKDRISRIYRNFNLTVTMGQLHSVRIYVTGQARQPGSFTVSGLSTLVNAIFVTGGPSPQGSFRHIEVRRDGKIITDFDLYALLIYGDKSKDVALLPGDVIYIPPVGPQAALFGSVRNSAIYELKADSTVSEIVKAAGGLSVLASMSNASIERIGPKHERTTIPVELSAGGNTAMADGDILRVTAISPRFSQTVTIRGNVADPGRYGWHEGLKLSELIPDSSALVTRNYWQRRNRAGLPSPDFEPDASQRFQTTPPANGSTPQTASGQTPTTTQTMQGLPTSTSGSGSTAQKAPVPQNQQTQPTNGAGYASTVSSQNSYATGQDAGQQLASQVGGTGTDNGSANINPSLPDCPANVLAQTAPQGANALVPGVSCNIRTTLLGGTTLADQTGKTFTENTAGADRINDIRLPAPDIDWAYAVVERLDPKTFQTRLIPFDLGKLVVAHDMSQDMELEPGDQVTIFSQADIRVPLTQQTKLVRVEGEVAHSGIYSVQPGETLRQVLERAGGLTPNAYLFGAEFTRASTRVAQQARLDDYVSQLELEIDRASIASTANALSPADAATSQSALQTTQLLIARLKLLRASGRIVLNLKPTSISVADMPALSLEDGDRLVIPSIPSSVNVMGSVYDPSSFLFDSKARVVSYLKQAGGPNRDADQKHVYIVRADGAVISKEASKSFWGNTFADEGINPGDTIVVPEKVYKGSALRYFTTLAPLFSSFAITAAVLANN